MSTGTSRVAGQAVRQRQSQRLTDLKYRWPARYRAAWAALVLVVIGAVAFAPHALDGASLSLVTGLAGVLAIASFGQMLIVMTGAIDLSISAIVSLAAGIVVHYGVGNGANVPALVAASLLSSVLLSLVNGFLIKVLRLNAVIVTLATVSMITGAIQLWTGVALSNTGLAPHVLQTIAQFDIYRINAVFLTAILLGIALAFHLGKTRTGRRITFIGSNRRAARVIGTRVTSVELMVFAIAGLLYGTAGVLLAGYVGSPDVLSGNQYQLLSITVAGVAGVLFTGGPASVASVIGSCLFLVLLDQVLSIVGIAPGVSVVIQGLVLAAAVSAITVGRLGVGFGRRRGRRSP
jgi:ribose transport system permease protein